MHLIQKNTIDVHLELDNDLRNFDKSSQYTIPIFIPHKGCGHECVFCNQRKISGKIEEQKVEDVDKIVSEHLSFFNNVDDKRIEIAFFGGSFTGISINEQIGYLEIANRYIESGVVDGIRISTRPDYISIPILKLMKKYNVTTIELGVQSLDDNVLLSSKRGHTKRDVVKASRLIKMFNIELGHQIMIGLPNSSLESEIYTIREVIKLGPAVLRIYPVYVIEPSELYDMYIKGTYNPLTIDEAVDRVYNVFLECKSTNIKIIRIGLHTTEIINSNNSNIAGPVCDNFAEYVIARYVRKIIDEKLNEMKIYSSKDKYIILNIHTQNKYASYISGPQKINKEYFIKKYNAKINLKIK